MVHKSSDTGSFPSGETPAGELSGGEPSPAFIADEMLGRLAKWLRLLGYDTLYAGRLTLAGSAALSDHQIAALARAQGRVVLTRDRELVRRKGIRCLWIESQILEEQLLQVVAAFGLPEGPGQGPGLGSRCPRCNTTLAEAPRHEVRPHVPPYVWQTQRRFAYCRECDQYYWQGTHWQHVQATISRVLGDRKDGTVKSWGE